MYKAKLKSVSSVDAGGYVEVFFEGYVDGELKYPNLTTYCHPEQVEQKMQEVLQSLKERVEIAEAIPENLEVTI